MPFALAMYTRRSGVAEGWWPCWTERAKAALPGALTITTPSTPAVRRPALRSVTRRTL